MLGTLWGGAPGAPAATQQAESCIVPGLAQLKPMVEQAAPLARTYAVCKHRPRTSAPGRPGANLRPPPAWGTPWACLLVVHEAVTATTLSRPGPSVVLHGAEHSEGVRRESR